MREREISYLLVLSPQIALLARAEPDGSQEPGSSSGSPGWVEGTQAHESSCAAFPGTLARNWIGSEAA